MYSVRHARSALAIAIALAIALPTATAARAASSGSSSRQDHCALNLHTGAFDCFATFTEVVRLATGGRVTDAPPAAAQAVGNPGLLRRMGFGVSRDKVTVDAAGFAIIIGLEFDGANHTGDAFTTYHPTSACTSTTADIDFALAVMHAGWDNRISSFMNFNGCFTKHYDGTNYTGASTGGFFDDRTTMPAGMDNRTGSLQFS
ncbi:peptidase inhibitor family I36 protein [Nonomuraea sp. NPDC055795]